MKKPRHHVTDHALLRFMERAQGFDIEAIRRDLGRRIDAACAGHEGHCGVTIDGFTFRIVDDRVVTVYDQKRREHHLGSYMRRREQE